MILTNSSGKGMVIWGPTCIALTFLLLIGCAATKPNQSILDPGYTPPKESKTNENFSTAKAILTEISLKNDLLAIELGKLPQLQDDISVEEVGALENILKLYEIDPIIFNSAFDRMYKEGYPEKRKFCTPLQALLWLSEKDRFSKDHNPLIDYDLKYLLKKAWGVQGVILSEEEIDLIRYGLVYQGDRDVVYSLLSDPSLDLDIFGSEAFKEEVRRKWSSFDEVTERLNSPKLVFEYVKSNIYFPWKIRGMYPWSPQHTFKSRRGNCAGQALFVDYCLKKAGYDSVVLRYVCTPKFCGPQRGNLSYTKPTPYHWTVVYKSNGALYQLDAGRHYMGGPYKTYSEVAGNNPFVFRTWRDHK